MRRTIKKLQRTLNLRPVVHEGRRGVSAELSELDVYIDQHDLTWADGSALTDEILRGIPSAHTTLGYSAGNRNTRSHYRQGTLTGRPELTAARNDAHNAALDKAARLLPEREARMVLRLKLDFAGFGA